MAIETTPLGFQKPDGGEAVRNGDNVIAANAQKAEDRFQEDHGRLNLIEAKNADQDELIENLREVAAADGKAYTDEQVAIDRGRLNLIEETNAVQDGRLSAVEAKNTGQDGRLTDLEAVSPKVSNIDIDTDGVPYYSPGSTAVHIIPDGDGEPYFITFMQASADTDGTPYF